MWKRAKEKNEDIIDQTGILSNRLAKYIEALNQASVVEQGEKSLKIDHFDATDSALRVMDNVVNNLYVKLSKVFKSDIPLKNTLDEFVGKQRKKLLNLKVKLYSIYAAMIDRAQRIRSDIEKFKQKIGEELGKDPVIYEDADFYQAAQVVDELVEYIKALNEASKEEKNRSKPILKIDDFAVTALALQVMNRFIWDLYRKLARMHIQRELFRGDLQKFHNKQETIFSELKTDLYNIYEVKKEADDKIAIRYYYTSLLPGRTGFYYSGFRDDLLTKTELPVGKIEAQGLKSLKYFGKEAAATLAEAILGQIGIAGEGIAGVVASAALQRMMERERRQVKAVKRRAERAELTEENRIYEIVNLAKDLALRGA